MQPRTEWQVDRHTTVLRHSPYRIGNFGLYSSTLHAGWCPHHFGAAHLHRRLQRGVRLRRGVRSATPAGPHGPPHPVPVWSNPVT
jgi:hypothetical protein